MGKQEHEHSLGARASGWASFALLCLVAQEERGVLFWVGAGVCGVWLGVGLYILAAEINADALEARERLSRLLHAVA